MMKNTKLNKIKMQLLKMIIMISKDRRLKATK